MTAVVENAKVVVAAAVAAAKCQSLFILGWAERIYRKKIFYRNPWTNIYI